MSESEFVELTMAECEHVLDELYSEAVHTNFRNKQGAEIYEQLTKLTDKGRLLKKIKVPRRLFEEFRSFLPKVTV